MCGSPPSTPARQSVRRRGRPSVPEGRIIKAGGFSRFALYDLENDPLQKEDISQRRPKVTACLKEKLLTLYKDVMADAPDWPSK